MSRCYIFWKQIASNNIVHKFHRGFSCKLDFDHYHAISTSEPYRARTALLHGQADDELDDSSEKLNTMICIHTNLYSFSA